MIPENKTNGKIRNVKLSPLFEAGKRYDMDSQKEDQHGNLGPEYNHCWLTWQSTYQDENGNDIWINQAENYKSLEDAKKDFEMLKNKSI